MNSRRHIKIIGIISLVAVCLYIGQTWHEKTPNPNYPVPKSAEGVPNLPKSTDVTSKESSIRKKINFADPASSEELIKSLIRQLSDLPMLISDLRFLFGADSYLTDTEKDNLSLKLSLDLPRNYDLLIDALTACKSTLPPVAKEVEKVFLRWARHIHPMSVAQTLKFADACVGFDTSYKRDVLSEKILLAAKESSFVKMMEETLSIDLKAPKTSPVNLSPQLLSDWAHEDATGALNWFIHSNLTPANIHSCGFALSNQLLEIDAERYSGVIRDLNKGAVRDSLIFGMLTYLDIKGDKEAASAWRQEISDPNSRDHVP
jgi:hypothetical protein